MATLNIRSKIRFILNGEQIVLTTVVPDETAAEHI